ncbi:acyl-CoA dehydrogenase family protein [Streptomyces brasiliscabiei]|uniref:Acyl-CoA dehydrogenase family protein n=1 Tax=Streptomyces brasiliscabiei TaxID=2736302 RepID=A0ABU8GQ38_9ACTN
MTAPGPLIDTGRVDLDGFDRALGDPADPAAPLSFARGAELDRAERFPEDGCRELDRAGLPRLYVPAEFGGALTRYDELVAALRLVARRDLTVAIAHGKTFLGGVCVWLAGSPEQARDLGADIVAGTPVAWGLTEPGHGSDLLAGEMTATPEPGAPRAPGDPAAPADFAAPTDPAAPTHVAAPGGSTAPVGFRVHGEKWPVNNATRAPLLCLLVRTRPEGGPRGFSLLLADKRRLPADRWRTLPKVPTHGIRGADISGIALDDCPFPADALIGEEGAGLEIVLKALQLTRTAVTALSLGAADQAVRLAEEFAARRELYGRRLIELPHVRRVLGEAYAALHAAEIVSVLAARGVHTLPQEMAVISAVAKSYVPTRVDELITACGELLGARAFLTGVHEHGAFQKLERDHRVVGVFDGSTFVNQHVLINHFPLLARGHREGTADEEAVRRTADLSVPPPPARLDRLSLLARGGCGFTQSLRAASGDVRALASTGQVPARVAELAEELAEGCDRLHRELALLPPASQDVPPEAFALARRYEQCFAGAAALRVWLHNRASGEDPLWLEAVLTHVLRSVRPPGRPADVDDEVFDRLLDARAAGRPAAPPTSAVMP